VSKGLALKRKWWLKRSVEEGAPRKSPGAGLFHLAWKSRKCYGIPTPSTAPAATVRFGRTTREIVTGTANLRDSYGVASSSFDDCGVGGLIQTAAGWGGCFGRARVNRSGFRA
jgi:hypothetical protein